MRIIHMCPYFTGLSFLKYFYRNKYKHTCVCVCVSLITFEVS